MLKSEKINGFICQTFHENGKRYKSCDYSDSPDFYYHAFSKRKMSKEEARGLSIAYLSYQNWRPFKFHSMI